MKKIWAELFLFSIRRRYLLRCIACLLCAAGIWGVWHNRYSADMLLLLPESSRSVKNLNTVINSGIANKVTLYLSRRDGGVLDNGADMDTLSAFARKLKNVRGVTQVVTAPFEGSMTELYRDHLSRYPLLYPPSRLPRGDILTSSLRRGFRNLCLNPVTGAVQYRYDPFNWTTNCFSGFENVMKVSGTRFYTGNRLFVFSSDRKKCMILIYTDVAVTDYERSSALIEALQKLSGTLPEELVCDFFSPHMHMLENAKIMKTDLQIFALCTLIIFGMLFAFVYKFDWCGILIPFLAGVGSFFAAAAMGVFFDTMMLFVIAMGGVLIGIAGDYGIHLYAASLSDRKIQKGIALYPRLCVAFFTTGCAFFCFVFSGVPAFIQFGAYSFLTLLFAFLLLIFLLPGLLFCRRQRRGTLDFFHGLHVQKISLKHTLAALFVLCIPAAGVFFARFDTDIRKFDIACETLAEKEKTFQKSFTAGEVPYILLYTAASFDEMLEKCRKDQEKLKAAFPALQMVTPSDFFVPEDVQKSNLRAWRNFVDSGEWQQYKKMFYAKAASLGVETEFFSPFFNELEKGVSNPPAGHPGLLEFACKNMLGFARNRWTGAAMAGKKSISYQELLKNSSAVVISEETFSEQLFKDMVGKLPLVLPAAVIFIFLSVFMTLRSFTRTLLVFSPVAACLIGIFGMHGVLGQEISLAVIVAGIITIGISVDYGVLMVDSSLEPHLFNAIVFSAVTTAAGGMTVLFTTHPMLRAAGLTIVAGILSAAVFCFCILYPLLKKINGKKMLLWCSAALITAACVSGCSAFPQGQILPVEPGAAPERCVFPGVETQEFQGSCVLDYKVGQVTFVIAGKMSEEGKGFFTGFSPGGIKLFSLKGKGFELKEFNWHKSTVPPERQPELSRFLYQALSSALYVPPGATGSRCDLSEGAVVITRSLAQKEELCCTFSGAECTIARKEYRGRNSWSVKYCKKAPEADVVYIFSAGTVFQAYVKMKFL